MHAAVGEKLNVDLFVREPVDHVAEKAGGECCCPLLFNLRWNPVGDGDLKVCCNEAEPAIFSS